MLKEKDGYRLVWNEEFEGTKLDGRKWTVREDMRPREDNALADESNPEVMRVVDGELHLNSIRVQADGGERKYISCRSVTTYNKMHFRYGYLEMRAKVPFQPGAWPSFWLKSTCEIAPRKVMDYMVEVDIFEVFGSKDTVEPAIHKWYSNGTHTSTGWATQKKSPYIFKNCGNLSNEYHLYGFEWTPDEMSMYVDDEKYFTFDLHDDFDGGGDMEGFHDPLYIIMNNHVLTQTLAFMQNNRPGACATDESEFPLEYWIDWIRLYQKPGEGDVFLAE